MAEKLVSDERDKSKPRAVPVSQEMTSVAGASPSIVRSVTASSGKSSVSSKSAKQMCKNVEVEILSAVKSIQTAMQKQDQKISSMADRLSEIEKGKMEYEDEYYYEGEEPQEGFDYEDEEGCEPLVASQGSEKRKSDEQNSRFASMAKRFKTQEHCDNDIDETLAHNITELFRNGIDDDRYNDLIKDETNGRPANCEGLVTVKTNQLVWDAVTPSARTNNLKFQKLETSVVKAATVLSKVVNTMASIENEHVKFGEMIDNCNMSLALLGHSNKQICMMRRDLIKPEIKEEYSHLCTHSLPYSSWLFGDDISKKTKEIEDSNRLGYKIHRGGRGAGPRGRFGYGSRGRFRGRGRGAPSRGKPYYQSSYSSYSGNDPKNPQRRGGISKTTKA